MVEKVQFVSGLRPPDQVHASVPARHVAAGTDFEAVLRGKLGDGAEVRFSAHALRRLESRGIRITADEKRLIEEGVRSAADKGARESLLVTDRFALVVSVTNRTVITARHNDDLEGGVFTNIDSAVICRGVQPASELVGDIRPDRLHEAG